MVAHFCAREAPGPLAEDSSGNEKDVPPRTRFPGKP